jgi:enamine deaminase RidA (YjgF/YER057c/UK114 family)
MASSAAPDGSFTSRGRWPSTKRRVSSAPTSPRSFLDNVIDVVRAAGGGSEHIVKLLAFVTDLDKYRAAQKPIGDGWRARMGNYWPAMSLVKVAGLLEPGALVEIEGTAVLPAEETR